MSTNPIARNGNVDFPVHVKQERMPEGLPHAVHSTKEIKRLEQQGTAVSVGEEQLIAAIERANKALQGVNTSFEFSIHDETKQITVKVINKDNGEVIRQIPNEKILDMVAKLWELSGLLVDEKR